MNDDNKGYAAPAVVKAFEVLKIIADSDVSVRLTDLSEHMECSKGTMHGLLRALIQVNALKKKKSRYVMGPLLADLTLRDWNFLKINEKVKPSLEKLRDVTGETVFLGVFGESISTIMATAESNNPMKISSPVGTEIPLHAGAVGKVFLSAMEDISLTAYLSHNKLPRFTKNTIVDNDKYYEEIQMVRKKGYALDNEEYLPGVRAIASPLNNCKGLPMAVWIAGFTASMNGDALSGKVQEVLNASDDLREILDS